MDVLFSALSNEFRIAIVRELRQSPGLKHGELLKALGLSKGKAGTLSKAFESLEAAGLVLREDGKYRIVDRDAIGRLLVAAADLDISAKRMLLERAEAQVPKAERLASQIRDEVDSA